MERLMPTLHKPVPLQTRVRVHESYLGHEVRGTVAGIASQHVVFMYIIVLDEPHVFDGEAFTAITVVGSHLMNENGEFEWKR